MQKYVFLAMAGGLGALSRYAVAGFIQRLSDASFPYGTFAVNALGCLMFGLIWGVLEQLTNVSPQIRVVVLTGFMGAFTTFSTFAFESAGLMQQGNWLGFAANVAGQNILGIAAVMLGLSIANFIVG